MKILVTGATGMLGRNIVDGFNTTSHTLLAPTRRELNLFDEKNVLDYLDKSQPDFIIHCAGKVGGILANIDNPYGFFIENLDMGRNIVLSAEKVGIPRLINMGSSCMYPRNASNPLKELQVLTGELEPTNEGYALAKISVQRLCAYISQKDSNLKYKTLIPCNLYGLYDKFDPKAGHLIPAVIRKIYEAKINNDPLVTIWGDGTARREFLYASNVTDFILKKLPEFDQWPDLMNIGLGSDYTVSEYYELIKEVIGYKGSFNYDLSKPTGMMRKLVDVALQTALEWNPPIDTIEGLRLTYKYYLSTIEELVS